MNSIYESYHLVGEVLRVIEATERELAGQKVSEIMDTAIFEAYQEIGGRDYIIQAPAA